MKVLMSAYSCEPGRGSEPGVGWNWVLHAAPHHEVWVLTRPDKRERLLEATGSAGLDGVHWVFFDVPWALRFFKRGQRGIRLHYLLWQLAAIRAVRKLHAEQRFDVAHHVTFVSYWMPSCLAWLPIPFVWGPVGGGERAPSSMDVMLGARGRAFEAARAALAGLARRNPFLRRTARRAAVALATTDQTAERLRELGARDVRVLSQVALSDEERARLGSVRRAAGEAFTFLSVGRLLHWKGFALALEAFARVAGQLPDARYEVVGDGPERGALERAVARQGLEGRVRFTGHGSREGLWGRFEHVDALVHPSLHDSGAMVVAEAMAAGLPVVCLDVGGPALQVTQETGFKIEATTPGRVVDEIADAMLTLARDGRLRERMSQAARSRVARYFSWVDRAGVAGGLYGRITGGR